MLIWIFLKARSIGVEGTKNIYIGNTYKFF